MPFQWHRISAFDLKSTVLICILQPDTTEILLLLYDSTFYVLLYASARQYSPTDTPSYDGNFRLIFVYNGVPRFRPHRNQIKI